MRATTKRPARRRLLAGAAVLLLVGLVAGCTGGGGGDAAMSDSAGAMDEGALRDSVEAEARGPAADQDSGAGVNRALVQTRAVIKTGRITLTGPDLDELRTRVDDLLFSLGGAVDNEQTSHDRDGGIEYSTLVLRVPVDRFGDAMSALEELGTMRSSDTNSKDVTTQVIDVDERVQTLQNSLNRLQRFQRESTNIDDLILFEDQITRREQELSSLQAQQSYLADQTSMSTVTLTLSRPDKYVPPPGALEDAGFLTGLKSGWNALKDAVVVSLTVVGAVLPFAATLALVGVPVWLLVRSVVRRRHGFAPATATVAPEPPAE